MASRDIGRPNFLVIVSDDQGPWALGCAGNEELQTPALDALAADGTRLDRFFCASPVCSPARGSLLTGRMPSAHGVHDWIRGEAYGVVNDADVEYLGALITTPEVLSGAGWICGYSGKWHLGTGRQPAPGFDFWYAHRTGDGPYVGAPVWRNGRRESEPRYLTDAITEEALSFLRGPAAGDLPFYLSVHYTAPHSPWVGQHPKRWLDLYDDCDFTSCPQQAAHPWFSWEPGPVSSAMGDPQPSLQGYFASLSAMDAGIATLLTHLDAARLREYTVVIFTSDNGFSCGQHGIWGKGNATWPLNVWENSVRVPAIVRWPGQVPADVVRNALVSACDLHPTLLDLAGLDPPDDPYAAGRSVAGLLRGQTTDSERESVLVFDEYGGTRMVRNTSWKYVWRAAAGPEELYDLDDDPEELHNLASEPSRRNTALELQEVLRDWFAGRVDPRRDAWHRPVSGRGQLQPVGTGADNTAIYYSGEQERRHPL